MLTIKELSISTGVPTIEKWFCVSNLEIIDSRIVRIWFTQKPSDASLSLSYFTLTGGTTSSISRNTVSDHCLDLWVTNLTQGQFTLVISGSVTSYRASVALTSTAIVFDTINVAENTVNNVNNVNPESIMNWIPETFKSKPKWQGFIQALDTGNQIVRDLAQNVFNQLYLYTATDSFLNTRAANVGVNKPYKLGLSDESFRYLAISVSNQQIIEEAFLNIADILYGKESVRAYHKAGGPGPYRLYDGMTLTIGVDGGSLQTVAISSERYVNIAQATTQELAADLTIEFEHAGIKAVPLNINNTLYIYIKSKGLASSLTIAGGTLLTAVPFEAGGTPFFYQNPNTYESIFSIGADHNYTWHVSNPSTGVVRFESHAQDHVTHPFHFHEIYPGDILNITGPVFPASVCGSWVISDVNQYYSGSNLYSYIDIKSTATGLPSTIVQSIVESFVVVKNVTINCYNDTGWVAVNPSSGEANISIPSTSKAVQRSPNNGAYLNTPYTCETNLSLVQYKNQGQSYAIGRLNIGDFTTVPGINEGLEVTNFVSTTTPFNSPYSEYGSQSWFLEGSDPAYALFGSASSGAIEKNSPTSWTQYAWTFGGVSGHPSWTISNRGWFHLCTKNRTNNVVGSTISATFTHTAFATIFPIAITIKSETRKNQLFIAGGFDTYLTSVNGNTYFANGVSSTVSIATTTPYNMIKSGACEIPTHHTILVCGGALTGFFATAATDVGYFYNLTTDSWSPMVGTLKTARLDHQCILLNDETILVVGGRNGSWETPGATHPSNTLIGNVLNSCELITVNGTTNSVAPVSTGRMAYKRFAFGSIVLPDGRVLVVGGVGYHGNFSAALSENQNQNELKSAEIYDPVTGGWSSIPDMLDTHSSCTVSYNPDQNQIMVFGGLNSIKAEYLDLNTMTWHYSGNKRYGEFFPILTAAFGAPFTILDEIGCIYGGGYLAGGVWYSNTKSWTVNNNYPNKVNYNGINGLWRVLSNDSNYIYITPMENRHQDFVAIAGTCNVTKFRAPTPTEVGATLIDPTAPYQITNTRLGLNQVLKTGANYSTIQVDSGGTKIENDTWIIIGYGFDYQQGPIKCIGHVSDTEIMVDPSFRFSKDIDPNVLSYANTDIVIVNRGVYSSNRSFSKEFVLTASNAGREAFLGYINQISATGIYKNIETRYPSDRGLGNEGSLLSGLGKLSNIVEVYGKDDVDEELKGLRNV